MHEPRFYISFGFSSVFICRLVRSSAHIVNLENGFGRVHLKFMLSKCVRQFCHFVHQFFFLSLVLSHPFVHFYFPFGIRVDCRHWICPTTLKWLVVQHLKIHRQQRPHHRCTIALARMPQRMSSVIPTHLVVAAVALEPLILHSVTKNRRIIAYIQRQPFAILIQTTAIISSIQTQISLAAAVVHTKSDQKWTSLRIKWMR